MPGQIPFTIELESFADVQLPKIKRWSIESGFGNPYDTFTVTFVVFDGDRVGDPRIAEELLWERVRISIDGRPYLLGRFEESEIGGSGAEITMMGYDYRFELAEADIDPEVKIKDGMTLEAALKQASACCGIAHIRSDGNVRLRDLRTGRTLTTPAPSDFRVRPMKEYCPNSSEKILPYMQRICARHGLFIQPGKGRDELVLAAPDYAQDTSWDLIRYRETGNSLGNVTGSRCKRDMRKVPTYVQYDGQTAAGEPEPKHVASVLQYNAGTLAGPPERPAQPDAIVVTESIDWPSEHIPRDRAVSERLRPSTGVKLDDGVYRPFFRRDTDSKSVEQLKDSMLRGLAERMKDMLRWEGRTVGHGQKGYTFANNTMANVADEVCGVEQRMWIETVRLEGDASGGTTASLTARLPGTYPVG